MSPLGLSPPRLVIVDRDGVLDREPASGWLAGPEAWEWEDGALDGLAALASARVPVAIVTNQSGIGRGVVTADEVASLHTWLADRFVDLGVDLVGIFTCPHAPEGGCACRKPGPGLILEALARAGAEPSHAVMIGDAPRDIEAGRAAGVATILVRTGKGRDTEAGGAVQADAVADHLGDAVRCLLTPGADRCSGA